MKKEASGSLNKLLAAILIGVMLILMIGIVASGWQTDNNGENSGEHGDLTGNAENLNGDTDKKGGTADNFYADENPEQKIPEHINYLTGLEIKEEYENRIPFAMVTEANTPSYGISGTELLIEIPTEKSTRFVIFKTDINGLGKLGAFASTRNYITQLTGFFGGSIVSNGCDDVISYASLSTDISFDLSRFSDVMYKENGKNIYTDSNSIIKISKDNNIDLISYKKPIIPFEFADFGEAVLGKTEAKTVNITYSEQNKTALVYDADKQNYVLYKNERIKTDMLNGETVSFKNVFVLFADIVTYETASGTESVVKNDTSGTGYYISNGALTEIKWCKDSSGELTFRTLIGNKLIINRGNSYIGYYKSSAMDTVTFQ